MACPCEILIDSRNPATADALIRAGAQEAMRIEHKFSRYRDDNIVHQINLSAGRKVQIDAETYRLLQFADQCFQISDGLFDISSGVLRRIWKFDGEDQIPVQSDIDALLGLIGWHRVDFDRSGISLPPGMEIDFGGIGKEYAVDRVLQLLREQSDCSIMVNFGGDCHANAAPREGGTWITGIENPLKPGDAAEVLRLNHGALATSGDAYRHIEVNGLRYGHIINPQTGWPVADSPRSVTVAAATCIEAGVLSTLAILQGADAEDFLQQQAARCWVYR